MNKSELVDAIAKGTGLSKVSSEDALNHTVESIQKALKKGDSVALVGFGTFKVSKRAARMGRNPQTGAALKIPARKVVRFSVGKGLKDAVK